MMGHIIRQASQHAVNITGIKGIEIGLNGLVHGSLRWFAPAVFEMLDDLIAGLSVVV